MPRAKKVSLECVGQVVDRKCKKSTVKFTIDPTPEGWLLKGCAIEFEGEWAELFDDANAT